MLHVKINTCSRGLMWNFWAWHDS